MIPGEIISKRYGDAFVEFAERSIGIEKCIEEVKALKNVAINNPEFMTLILSPAITVKEKIHFIDEVLQQYFSPEFLVFLKIVVEKGRMEWLMNMLDYIRVSYSHGEAVEAVIKCANLLDLDTVKEIQEKVQQKLGKKMYFYLDLDPDLLGGVQVVVGNTVLDGSVKKRMEELRQKVRATRIT